MVHDAERGRGHIRSSVKDGTEKEAWTGAEYLVPPTSNEGAQETEAIRNKHVHALFILMKV